jgi:hypothetical protein
MQLLARTLKLRVARNWLEELRVKEARANRLLASVRRTKEHDRRAGSEKDWRRIARNGRKEKKTMWSASVMTNTN